MSLAPLEAKLQAYTPNDHYRHDRFAYDAVQQALEAVQKGNFGIGAILVHQGEIIARAQNRVMNPRFDSKAHAEMVLLDDYEKRYEGMLLPPEELELITSLEPCPMCYGRLIIGKVGNIYSVTPDEIGGMTSKAEHLPCAFVELAEGKAFEAAECSPELTALSLEIFLSNAESLNARIKEGNV